MRRDERFTGQPSCVRESFEERNTSASSSCHGEGSPAVPEGDASLQAI
jgi:hypothetical protein